MGISPNVWGIVVGASVLLWAAIIWFVQTGVNGLVDHVLY